MARNRWVVGNWKMNGSHKMALQLLQELARQPVFHRTQLVVLPPFVYLPLAQEQLRNTSIGWGAQTLSEYSQGAYTGEISGDMLREWGCRYVAVGHSERRTLYHETNEIVALKFKAAQSHGLTPILCVGETIEERNAEQTLKVVLAQVDAVIQSQGVEVLAKAMVAYEPIWAIGTGLTASPQQAQAVHEALRQYVATHDVTIAKNLPILYGGSMKPDNAAQLFAMPDIDGGLIGGASLKSADFLAIAQQADSVFC